MVFLSRCQDGISIRSFYLILYCTGNMKITLMISGEILTMRTPSDEMFHGEITSKS